ncbi:PepSY domain-containing protein [bacterium]|nr:PepSY domain-containing protein [bacterium]
MSRIILLSLIASLAFSAARAEIECTAGMANWKPVADLVAAAEQLGWTVTKVRADDGCYHVRATDRNGRAVQAVFDPETLKLLGRSGDDNEGKGDHDTPVKGSSE